MRLGQLSRKLGVSTSQIIDFLASKDIAIGEDSNAKIEDEHANWVTQKYAPQLMEAVTIAISEEKAEPVGIVESPVPTEAIEAVVVPASIDEQPATDTVLLPIEVIKAPKIELSGLKVLCKIEIPEKKKKETASDAMASGTPIEETERKVQPDRRPSTNRRKYEERPRKNPIALQREREEREAEKRRKEEILRAKQKKAQHYQNKVKGQVATKRIKMIEEPLEKMDAPIEVMPTTWWGKFKKWLRT
jgi:hypothetical protein